MLSKLGLDRQCQNCYTESYNGIKEEAMAKTILQAINNSTKWEILVETVQILARHNPHSSSLAALRNVLYEMDRKHPSLWDMKEITQDLVIALYLALPLSEIVPTIKRETNVKLTDS